MTPAAARTASALTATCISAEAEQMAVVVSVVVSAAAWRARCESLSAEPAASHQTDQPQLNASPLKPASHTTTRHE